MGLTFFVCKLLIVRWAMSVFCTKMSGFDRVLTFFLA